VHSSRKLLFSLSGLDGWLPEVALLPDQPSEAVHDSALLAAQRNVVVPLTSTFEGVAVNWVSCGFATGLVSGVGVVLLVPSSPLVPELLDEPPLSLQAASTTDATASKASLPEALKARLQSWLKPKSDESDTRELTPRILRTDKSISYAPQQQQF
jgi:hypothetical protein